MSNLSEIQDEVTAVLNPPMHEKYEEAENSLWEDFSLLEEVVSAIHIVDAKGKRFKFPGSYKVSRQGSEITLTSL
jgi:hypothetical protein